MKNKFLLLFFAVFTIIFTSCSIADTLGFDTYDYMSETVTKVHDVNSEEAGVIEELLEILVTDSASLPTFENMEDAIDEYRDAVLFYMLETEYAKYSGNTDLIQKAMKVYPEYVISQIIPVNDFEATMYRYFGGDVKITNKNGNRFKYLSKVDAYVCPALTKYPEYVPVITAISESDKTYRVNFHVASEDNSTISEEYFALIIKRDDGTLYFKKLLPADEVK